MVEIQENVCIGCGACVKDCPVGALRLREKRAEYAGKCILCGHCVAVCPVNAVSIPEYDMEEVEEYRKEDFTLDAQTFLRAVKFRRSIRNFTDRQIDQTTMEGILNAGRYTATAKNTQGNTFTVVQKELQEFKDLVWKELAQMVRTPEGKKSDYGKMFAYFCRKREKDHTQDALFFNCTAFLAVGSLNPLDGGLAAANMEQMAVASGAGALYSGYLQRIIAQSQELTRWLNLEGKQISCCMLLGYPDVRYRRTAPRRKADIIWK